MKNRIFAYAKNKGADQLCSNSNAQLISAYVFATQIAQSLFYLNPKFQGSSFLCDCTGWSMLDLFRNPEYRFSRIAASISGAQALVQY